MVVRWDPDEGSVFVTDGDRAFRVRLRAPDPDWWRLLEEVTGPQWSVLELEPADISSEGVVRTWNPVRETALPQGRFASLDEFETAVAHFTGSKVAGQIVEGLRRVEPPGQGN